MYTIGGLCFVVGVVVGVGLPAMIRAFLWLCQRARVQQVRARRPRVVHVAAPPVPVPVVAPVVAAPALGMAGPAAAAVVAGLPRYPARQRTRPGLYYRTERALRKGPAYSADMYLPPPDN